MVSNITLYWEPSFRYLNLVWWWHGTVAWIRHCTDRPNPCKNSHSLVLIFPFLPSCQARSAANIFYSAYKQYIRYRHHDIFLAFGHFYWRTLEMQRSRQNLSRVPTSDMVYPILVRKAPETSLGSPAQWMGCCLPMPNTLTVVASVANTQVPGSYRPRTCYCLLYSSFTDVELLQARPNSLPHHSHWGDFVADYVIRTCT